MKPALRAATLVSALAILVHADPCRADEPQVAAIPGAADETRATVRIEAPVPNLRVVSGPAATIRAMSGCVAPCDVEVRAVEPELFVISNPHAPLFARDLLVVRGLPRRVTPGESFVLDYESRNTLRWIGGGIALAAAVGATAMIAGGLLANPIHRCDGEGCYTDYGPPDVPLVVGGGAVFAVGVLVGTVLLSLQDRVTARLKQAPCEERGGTAVQPPPDSRR